MPFKNPDDRRKYKQEYRKRQTEARRRAIDGFPEEPNGEPPNGSGTPPPPNIPDDVTQGTPDDDGDGPTQSMPFTTGRHAVVLLQEQINRVRKDKQAGVQTKARSVGYLIAVGLRALEVTDLAERVAALEAQNQ